ncbi:KIR-like protein [Plasmodium coatneyi]|uniref:KIR-like protein n=1 Tax=Plasmodium coatneyi TaxID=208452 RepID=A0A1B1E5L3_9APIC|nr:KIR-like protein [Plasmodium coatneyi]ANQ10257.1 KIR-like protein [Plasmodium coatneyi]
MVGVDTIDPTTFPSYKDYYDNFEKGEKSTAIKCDDQSDCGKEIKKYQLTQRNLTAHLHQTMVALDYIYKTYGSGQKKSLECTAREFFYYWLGDRISKGTGRSANFRTHIGLLCDSINSPSGIGLCKIPRDNPDETTFQHRKIIFDYYNDYNYVKQELQKDDPNCKGKWSSYLDGICAACKAVKDDCAQRERETQSEKAYCEEFEKKYGAYCDAATLPEMQSKLEYLQKNIASEQDATQSTRSQLNDALSKANTSSSLSSAFGTIALMELPLVIFYLYKYKPWSSWFGNHSSGNSTGRRSNRRKRRSAGQNFDVSAEETFTEYSTDNSTIGDLTAENSTTLRSSAYTRPPRRNRRAGAGTNDEAGHRNVGYGRIKKKNTNREKNYKDNIFWKRKKKKE